MSSLTPSVSTHDSDRPLVELIKLTAGYDNVPVVRDLSLFVDEGEVVALLGPNGAGKTTTLLTISGLLEPLGGECIVLGHPAGSKAPHQLVRSGIAHVPEDRSLFFDLTVHENLRLACVGSRAARRASVGRALELFPSLGGFLDRRAGALSGGEQQMLAIARALASEPRVLMVDEMSLGLAPIIVERLLPILRRVADDYGTGVLIVEQHVQMALNIADRAYVLSHGQLQVSGRASDLAKDREILEVSYLGQTASVNP